MKLTNSISVTGLVLLTGYLFGACDQPSDFPQFTKDRTLAYSILYYSTVDLFNSTLAGKPSGTHNFDADCPKGGTVHVEGTTQSIGTVAVDVSYDMQNCRFNDSNIMDGLILHGKLQHTANYDSAGFGGHDIFSEDLHMEGRLFNSVDQANINQQCEIEISYIESETSITLLGTICGRETGFPLWHVTYEEEEEE